MQGGSAGGPANGKSVPSPADPGEAEPEASRSGIARQSLSHRPAASPHRRRAGRRCVLCDRMITTLTLAIAERGSISAPLAGRKRSRHAGLGGLRGHAFGVLLPSRRRVLGLPPGRRRFSPEQTGKSLAVPNEDVSDDLVIDTYRRTIAPMTLQLLGRQVLHASAIESPGGVIGLRRLADGQVHNRLRACG